MAELPEGTQMRRDETGVVRSVLLPRQRRHRGSESGLRASGPRHGRYRRKSNCERWRFVPINTIWRSAVVSPFTSA
jgi:hypothetical protein